jgi:hypothetical protein
MAMVKHLEEKDDRHDMERINYLEKGNNISRAREKVYMFGLLL